MKTRTFALAALLGLAGWLVPAAGAQPDQAELLQRKEKKLDSAFLKNGSWTTDYDEALKMAKQTGKMVFGYFTRSYAP